MVVCVIGDANSVATASLKNIRTVRAFGAEPIEIDKFEKATGEGLSKGLIFFLKLYFV